jgi:release factor glutamine methyltransferase
VPVPLDAAALTELLSQAGFVAADEEADDLLACAAGDAERLEALVARRLTGEPIAWITGRVSFCGIEVRVEPGVYAPRWHTEALARRAADHLPEHGTAIDVCTGSGAVALVLQRTRPEARVIGTDVDERAAACARANGIEVHVGDLLQPLPGELRGASDVLVGVVPYVPTPGLCLLQRDTFAFESTCAYDGGRDGTDLLRRVLVEGRAFLRTGGVVLLELGGDQAELLACDLDLLGYVDVDLILDEEEDVRGIEATWAGRA